MPRHHIRVCEIAGVPWRTGPGTVRAAGFGLTGGFRDFVEAFEDQIPSMLAQRLFGADEVSLTTPVAYEGADIVIWDLDRVELLLLSLPFPANQMAALAVVDFATDEPVGGDDPRLKRLLRGSITGNLRLGGRLVADLADALAAEVGAVRERPADPDESARIQESHTLVFVQTGEVDEAALTELLISAESPFRPEFVDLDLPASLNREQGAVGLVSRAASLFAGQPASVEISIMLTTVQAVATAARFRRIWADAYYQVTAFQTFKQSAYAGQTRSDLEQLADEFGNLELDLAFNVETAADLGLVRTRSVIDDFHRSIYAALRITSQAEKVGQMFERVAAGLAFELAAIESREKAADNQHLRTLGGLILGVLTFVVAPMGVVLGFFGVNAREVDAGDSMFDLRRYWPIYLVALVVMALSIGLSVAFARVGRGGPRRGRAWGRVFSRR